MTRHPPVRLLSAFLFAVLLCSCGAHPGVDPAAASAEGQGVTAGSADASSAPAGGAGTPAGGGSVRGKPGGPGGPAADQAAGGTDVQAGGHPGAPGDVAVFEEAGAPYGALRQDAATKCANGVCTLLAPVVTAGRPDDVGGLDECIIRKKSDIHYDPPAQDGLFRKGARVRADVVCTAGTGGGAGGTTGNARSAASTSDVSPGADRSGAAPSS